MISTRPTLALLSPMHPFPPFAGGRAHMLYIIEQLARSYALELYVTAPEPEQLDWGPLSSWCTETRAFTPSGGHTLSLNPPAVRNVYSRELARFLHKRWRDQEPAIIQLEFTTMAQYA